MARRAARLGGLVLVLALVGAGLTACSGSTPTPSKIKGTPGPLASLPPAGSGARVSAAPTGAASASGSAGAAASTPTAAAGTPMIEVMKKAGCEPSKFTAPAGLAGGAVRTYIAQPQQQGKLLPGAAGRSATVARARGAAAFAVTQLTAARKPVAGCATTKHLVSVIDQDLKLLGIFGRDLAQGKVDPTRFDAVLAMHENVVAQASVLKLVVKDVVPTPQQLAG